MNRKLNTKDLVKETVILTAAVAIIAAAVYFFLVPSHASVSSISGLGIVLSNFVPLPLSVITMILNVVLLIIGFFTCGKEFGVKTVYTSILLPVLLGLFEKLFPGSESLTGSQELDVICLPGCVTASEIMKAKSLEIGVVKFFPAQTSGGIKAIKALAAPFGDMKFIPTGGINTENIGTYLENPFIAACGGSWMVKESDINAGNFEEITKKAQEALTLVRGCGR